MTLYYVQADNGGLDLFVRDNDDGRYNREVVLKIWRQTFFADDPEFLLEDMVPSRIFAVNEAAVGALRWNSPDGCKLVEEFAEAA
jgi:hypothetical protein